MAHASAIVDQAVALGVSVLVVAARGEVGGVSAFRRAASGRGVHIFPGFELTSSEGVHVLCIYPEDTRDEQLGGYLEELGTRSAGQSTNASGREFVGLLRGVRERGGVAFPAHATGEGGLFACLRGEAAIRAWRADDVLAIQIPGGVDELPREVREIVENKNADYRRSQAPAGGLAVAVVNAGVVEKPEDLSAPAATSWIKMSDVGIEGLRQAFLDPGSRIRLDPERGEVESEEHTELVALAWEGGFLDGAVVHFNPNLNVFVGGRGAGKSTVVESLRCVLGLDPVGEAARKAHHGIVGRVLKNGTRISLLVRSHRPVAREYRIERTIPNPPLVRDGGGQVSNLLPRDILPLAEIYGQHEIFELTQSREMLTRVLSRFVEHNHALARRKADLLRDLERSRRGILAARDALRHLAERLDALPGLEEQLQRFREMGLEERLAEQSLLVREERLLSSLSEQFTPFRTCLESLRSELPTDRAFLSVKALKGLPNGEILARADDALEELDRELGGLAAALEQALQRTDRDVAALRDEWETRKQDVQASYEKILRELQKLGVDGEEFIRLQRQIEALRPLRERRSVVRKVKKEHSELRRTQLAEWEDLKAWEFRRLARAVKGVNEKLGDRMQVEVAATADREPLFRLLRDEIGGRIAEAIEKLRETRDLSLAQFVEACREGPDGLNRFFGIRGAQAHRLAEAGPEVLMRIEELALPPTASIRLNTAPAGKPPAWQALEDLSTGQKATAVLLLLLLESEAPLVVDQPEDDLDNRFVTEVVVPRIREEKCRRQFIFATHNANIPVLGDAELIVGLSASGEAEGGHARIAPEHMGSIDAKPVRELVGEILEGGEEAFARRRRKYGF